MLFGFWNIRGLMDPLRRVEVRKLGHSNGLCMVGLLETKVPKYLFRSMSAGLLARWKWMANYDYSPKGRIWVGWGPTLVNFELISSNKQAIHGRVELLTSRLCCCTSVIYALHMFISRRPLWADLVRMSSCIQDLA